MTTGNLTVSAKGEGERADRYLAGALGVSRSSVKKMVESGLVLIEGDRITCHRKLSAGEIVNYTLPEKEPAGLHPSEDVDFSVIYENDNIAVINKPPGLVVHRGIGNRRETLLDGLAARYPQCELVHRLDKDTSGVMVIALNETSALNLREQFKQRIVKKIYLAIATGSIAEETGEISVPIRRSRKDPTKMSVGWSGARESVTRYRVVEHLRDAELVEIYPLSGRTHQIRVHFSYLGNPLLGDKKYGVGRKTAPRQMLHAWQISFKEPVTGGRMNFVCDPPDDFNLILEKYRVKML